METIETRAPTPRPIVGEEHLVAVGSAAALSILRDMSLEAVQEGRVSADEGTAAALIYGRLAAVIGGSAEAIAVATLLRSEASAASEAGAHGPARALLVEAASHLRTGVDRGGREAAQQLATITADPRFSPPDDTETHLERNAFDLIRQGATGDLRALETMIQSSLMTVDTSPLRSLVAAEQYARLAAAQGDVGAAMQLGGVLFLRAMWEDRNGGDADRLVTCAAEAISIAHEYAEAGHSVARASASNMIERLHPNALAAVAELFPPALAYCSTGGAC